jgi:hypothetical protein
VSESSEPGRRFSTYVMAADAAGMEATALERAREFFGPDADLKVSSDYNVIHYPDNMADQRYAGNITVREAKKAEAGQ